MLPFIVFILGAIIGSFLNVCIVRIPHGTSIVQPPSHCPGCKNVIRFYDNIPLISYFILLGHCRHCGERISPRYVVVDLLMASLVVALYHQFGLSLALVAAVIFVAALIVISFIDLEVRMVSDVISPPGIIVGLLFQ